MNDSEYRIPKEEFQRMITRDIPYEETARGVVEQKMAAKRDADEKWKQARYRAAFADPRSDRYTSPQGRVYVRKQPLTLIGIGGKPRAGKDAAADWLVAQHDFHKTFYSEILHEIGLTQNIWIDTRWDGAAALATKHQVFQQERFVKYRDLWDMLHHDYADLKTIPEVREYLLLLGTEVGRKLIYENVWVDVMEKKILAARAKGQALVVTGLRYQNEMDLLKRLGGVIVWVERSPVRPSKALWASDDTITPEDTGRARMVAQKAAEHEAENSASPDMFDMTLHNDGSLPDLYRRVEEMLK